MSKKLILLLFSFCLISCEKESSIQEDIIGKWYMPQTLNRITLGRSINDLAEHSLNAWNYSMMVTTNSNQSLIDRMSDPEGSVSITGTVNDEIKFMKFVLKYKNNLNNLNNFKYMKKTQQ